MRGESSPRGLTCVPQVALLPLSRQERMTARGQWRHGPGAGHVASRAVVYSLMGQGVIADLPKPQRGLWATVRLPSGPIIAAVSWHAPNAAGDGVEVKMSGYRAMSSWLRGRGPVVLGADLNSWRDPVDLRPPVPGDAFEAEHAFVGRHPTTGCRTPSARW